MLWMVTGDTASRRVVQEQQWPVFAGIDWGGEHTISCALSTTPANAELSCVA
jgi:hypothetical protein